MASSWFNIAPAGESQGSVTNPLVPAGTITISVVTGSANYNTLLNQGVIKYGGKEYTTFQGPFATAAQAKAALTQLVTGDAAIGQQIGIAAGGGLAGAGGNVSNTNAAGTLGTAGQAAGTALGFVQSLFTRANAVRLAEGILGLALVLVAVGKLGGAGKLAKKVPFI